MPVWFELVCAVHDMILLSRGFFCWDGGARERRGSSGFCYCFVCEIYV